MARIRIYSTRWCGYCVRAKALLDGKGIEYEEVFLDDDPAFRQKLFDLTGGAECGSETAPLVGYSAKAGGAVCQDCGEGVLALSPAGIAGIEALLARPLAESGEVGLAERSARDALAVITSAYEYFGNFRLRTLRSA